MTSSNYPLKEYSSAEEKVNIISHALGVVMSVIAFPFLILKALASNDFIHLMSFCIYGVGLIVLYLASTLFHSSKNELIRYKLNVFDHIAIFILIAGTYTPYALVAIKGHLGNVMFGVIWSIAFGGIILKLFFTGKCRALSTIVYVLMGWIAALAFKPLYSHLEGLGFVLLVIGGVVYTIGAILYSISKLKFNHAIFHVFVLLGSICHFISIYFYVL